MKTFAEYCAVMLAKRKKESRRYRLAVERAQKVIKMEQKYA